MRKILLAFGALVFGFLGQPVAATASSSAQSGLANSRLSRSDAERFLAAWARTVHQDKNLAIALSRPNPLIVTLGSAQFAFSEAEGSLTVWTVLFPDTTALVNPSSTLWRLNDYAGRHPETLAGGKIMIVDPKEKPTDPPQISLQRVFIDPTMTEAAFVTEVDQLSTAAFKWRRVYIEDAVMGRD
jgi:hypothetical protein